METLHKQKHTISVHLCLGSLRLQLDSSFFRPLGSSLLSLAWVQAIHIEINKDLQLGIIYICIIVIYKAIEI